MEKLVKLTEQRRIGDPFDSKTEQGPQVDQAQFDKIMSYIDQGKQAGAHCVAGGKRAGDRGYFVQPTVFANVTDEMAIAKEEIFGPVVCVYPYKDRDNAIKEANSLEYHFQAAVFTKNIDIAFDTVQKLNATSVMVNDHTAFRVDWMPFGGRDASGEGLGGIPYSMHEMTREKLMVVKSRFL
jgi:acyl-CoA reductase-like NAD-dependent aldehyde dehydrogenase